MLAHSKTTDIMPFKSGDKIYYTPDYGNTGRLAKVVEVYEDSMLIELESKCWTLNNKNDSSDDWIFDGTKYITVPSEHVYSRDMLEDW